MSTTNNRRLLAEAATLVGINLGELGADEHPWNSKHPQAAAWQMAVKELSPSVGEQMEVEHGVPLSMALAMALDGEAELTQPLLNELQTKRPQLYRSHKEAAISAAVQRMEEEMAVITAANTREAIAKRQAQQAAAASASRLQAQQQLRQQAGY